MSSPRIRVLTVSGCALAGLLVELAVARTALTSRSAPLNCSDGELGDGTMLKRGGLNYLAAKRLVDAPRP
jgi:hypothetical protein